MTQAEKERLAFLKKTRQSLKPFDIEPVPYSGWTLGIGQSTAFPPDEESATDEEDLKVVEEEKAKEETEEYEDEDTPPLPEPEDIHPIFQAVKPDSDMKTPGGLTDPARKDLNPGYYKQAKSRRSTAVQAIQWIPMDDYGDGFITGDILVAFARPSSNQKGQYGALYVAQSVDSSDWNELKNGESFGMGVQSLNLGKFDEKLITSYKKAHYDKVVSYWIWEDPSISTNRDFAEIEKAKAINKAIISKTISDRAALREKNRKRPFKARPKKKT